MTEPQPLRTLLVDDEPLAIERLQILCARVAGLHLVGTASDGAAALRMVEALKPDLLLLDIAIPGLDGMAVARALQGLAPRPAVIFITAFDQFAVAAFDVSAVDYLLKPVAQDRLERAVARVHAQSVSEAEPRAAASFTRELWVPHRAEMIRIAAREIDLIEAERDYMRLHVGPRSYLLHQTITELARRLDPGMFVRLHRSTIVQRDRIAGLKHDGMGGWTAQMRDGRELRIGRTYLADARAMAGR
ncbi:MAG: LytTR family two component transcriptional regulator [Rhodospirillales bacterium]|nr:LytTR family two component transcriptional regulator [Rhodospirillales bacterium]